MMIRWTMTEAQERLEAFKKGKGVIEGCSGFDHNCQWTVSGVKNDEPIILPTDRGWLLGFVFRDAWINEIRFLGDTFHDRIRMKGPFPPGKMVGALDEYCPFPLLWIDWTLFIPCLSMTTVSRKSFSVTMYFFHPANGPRRREIADIDFTVRTKPDTARWFRWGEMQTFRSEWMRQSVEGFRFDHDYPTTAVGRIQRWFRGIRAARRKNRIMLVWVLIRSPIFSCLPPELKHGFLCFF